MARQRHIPKGRPLMAGTVLLILLAAVVLASGRIINGIAVQMSGRIVTQISQYHYRLLQVEFERPVEVLTTAARFTHSHPAPSEAEMNVLTATLMETDPKIGCIWFMERGETVVRTYPRRGTPGVTAAGEERRRLVAELRDDSVRSCVSRSGETPVWSLVCRVRDERGGEHFCGVDLPLTDIYAYMTEQDPHSPSYATLFDPEGVIVYHPDHRRLGRSVSETRDSTAFREVLVSGRKIIASVVSDYLEIAEERIYYPLQLGNSRWVASIGIPRLAIEQEIDDFHLYTILTAVVSVLFFATLLVVAQRRWRREYDLRRLSEQESAQLHLQQVLEQIDPHFLFNRIELTTAIDPALRNWRIPAMSLQTLVENALKHNRITSCNPLHIRIRTEGESLLIENNFTPRSEGNAESLGVGLERIRSVYRFYTEENISIASDSGTFRCRLPLLPPEK